MNDNLPFDQFTTWQLAGDLLPNATPEQLVATGFSRCNVTTSEGGSIAPEFQYRYAVDRTSSMIQTWMGLTGGCAVCHDHKFDPLSTKEFYSLYAFFYSAADPAMDGNINVTAPFLKLPKPGQQEAVDSAAANEQTGRQQLEIAALDVEYMDPALQTPAPSPQVVVDILFDDFFPLGATTRNTSRNAHVWDSNPKFGAPSGRRLLRQANGFFYENIIQPQLKPITVPAQGKFCVWLRTDTVHTPKAVSIVFTAGTEIRRVIWGQPDVFSEANGKLVEKGTLPPAGEWTQLEVAADALDLGEGTQLTSLSLQQSGGIVWWDALTVSGESNPAADPLSSFSEWWKAQKGKSPTDVPIELQNILKDGPETLLSDELKIKLQKFYIGFVARPIRIDISRLRSDWEDARSARMTAEDAIQGTFIYQDVEQPRDAFVMLRGQYDKPGDKVEPNVPDILPRLKKEHEASRASRLDLANWLTAPDHPLTARVCANRIWQQIFGVGLVKTSFDFGSQGEPSSHPEMLDWLAIHFRESGWDVKGLVRLMVTSSTFRQQSRALPEVLLADPENRLYARGPRFRLDAEQIRDNALFASGLINLEMGGRGTRTYQPPNVWEPVGYSDSNTRYYLQDHGSALYRRSIYCFLKRTAPPPFMSNFDGPNREQPCSGRDRSNTPLQALQLMNDVQHFEAARALAERALEEGGASTESRITFLYRTVLARRPSGAEVESLTGALQQQLDLYRAEPEAAEKAIRVGESVPKMVASIPETAAWTMIANLVFNLDETLTRN